jgi:hypothetical protein
MIQGWQTPMSLTGKHLTGENLDGVSLTGMNPMDRR